MENKKKAKKQEKKETKEEDNDKLTIYDKIAIVSTLVLLVAFSLLLYMLYEIIDLSPDYDPLSSTYKRIGQILQNANRADNDKSNIQDTKYILNSLENATLAGPIYQTLVNYSLYEHLIFGIQARSSICREDIHQKAANQFSKLLTKMITLSGYKFQCNTEFIKGYLPICYSHNKKFKSIFALIEAMSQTTCSKDVYQSLVKASKQSNDFYLRFRILQFFDQHNNWDGVKFNNDEESDNLICSLSENAVESLPSSLDANMQKDFCTFANNHKCDVFSEQNVIEICQGGVKDESL